MAVIQGNLTSTERMYETLDLTSERSSQSTDVLQGLINAASARVRSIAKRDFKYGSETEYHDGDGGEFFLTNHFPIIAVTSVHVDSDRGWAASTALVEDTDFVVEPSTGAIRAKGLRFTEGLMNIRIIYTHGPPSYVIGPSNNTFTFVEDGTGKTATVASGNYNASTFATALNTALTSEAGTGITYTVVYNTADETFTVTASGDSTTTFGINVDADDPTKALMRLMGFNTETDKANALTYTSDEPSPGVPAAIEEACRMLISYWIQVAREKPWNHRSIERMDTRINLDPTDVPPFIKSLLEPYTRYYRNRSW